MKARKGTEAMTTDNNIQELTAEELSAVAGGNALLLAAAGALVAAGVSFGYNVVKGGTDSVTGAVDTQQAAQWLQEHPK
jgi:hypothetical protein